LIPALLLSTAVLGGGGYYYAHNKGSVPVGASSAGDSPAPQINNVQKESRAGQAPTTVVPATNVIEPEMVSIPAGTFTMGCDSKRDDVEGGCFDDEKPAHKVTLNAFQMGKYEVTFDQWDACEKAKACPHAEDQGWGRGKRPVINVSWDDIAQKYIPWLNQETGKSYRLPTEAEWEYAARGGTDNAYPWGNSIGKGNANCYKDLCGDKFDYTAPVGSFASNGYGLDDMNGNVSEWCQDWYGSYSSSSVSNPKGAASGPYCVVRGGSWNDLAQFVRSAHRSNDSPGLRNDYIGFRLVLP
jgi:formylglycine-generating enzyme required for sulfatase activity